MAGNGTGDASGTDSGTHPASTPDAAQIATTTVDAAGTAQGSPDAAQVATTTVDAAPSNPPKADPVMVLVDSKNVAKFEVWQGNTRLGKNATVVKVEPGTTVTITLKAKGYKDKLVTLDGTKQKIEERLDPKSGTTNGSGAPGIDCRHALKQPKNPECKQQFCDDADHFSNPACME